MLSEFLLGHELSLALFSGLTEERRYAGGGVASSFDWKYIEQGGKSFYNRANCQSKKPNTDNMEDSGYKSTIAAIIGTEGDQKVHRAEDLECQPCSALFRALFITGTMETEALIDQCLKLTFLH